MRIRTHKKKDFTIISNSTAQDVNLDLEELGFLTRCLSMPEDWEFNTQHIWNNWNIGRDKIRIIFNSLIKKNHCIRVVERNVKVNNMDGKVCYEIFDEKETCKKRVEELEAEGFKVQHSLNFDTFKKSISDPEKKAPLTKAPDSQGAYKETSSSSINIEEEERNKQTTTKEEKPPEIEKEKDGGGGLQENIFLKNSKGETISLSCSDAYLHFLKFPYETTTIQQAIQEIRRYTTPVNNIRKCLESIALRIHNTAKNPSLPKSPIKKEREKSFYENQPKDTRPLVKWGDFIKNQQNNKKQE